MPRCHSREQRFLGGLEADAASTESFSPMARHHIERAYSGVLEDVFSFCMRYKSAHKNEPEEDGFPGRMFCPVYYLIWAYPWGLPPPFYALLHGPCYTRSSSSGAFFSLASHIRISRKRATCTHVYRVTKPCRHVSRKLSSLLYR